MKISKSDLLYKDYSWTAIQGDNPKITGVPDSTLFNRHEGYEVLYLINHFALRNMGDANKLEKMIKNELPSDVRSQANVKNWLTENWGASKY
jgi:hypothetical protein